MEHSSAGENRRFCITESGPAEGNNSGTCPTFLILPGKEILIGSALPLHNVLVCSPSWKQAAAKKLIAGNRADKEGKDRERQLVRKGSIRDGMVTYGK